MKRITYIFLYVLIGCSFLTTSTRSQNKIPVLSKADKLTIIKKAISLLRENYIFPDKVTGVEKSLMAKYNSNEYEKGNSLEDFLAAINNDLEIATNDKHVNISFGPDRVKQIIKEKQNEGKTVPLSKEWRERLEYENFRLRKVEWLDGNIGYFRFLNFVDLQVAKESIMGAMNFIRHSNAIILDIRDNGGGSSETLNFVLSYFLKDKLKLGEFHFRKNNRVEEIRIKTDPLVKKVPDNVPVYVLVSNKTASAAEGLAVTLQSFKRATIIGENTKGEGNPGELFVINDQLYILIPTAISVSAVQGTKPVQGNGVSPDIVIAPEKAMDKAMLEICKTLAQNTTNRDLKQVYDWQVPVWESNINPPQIPAEMKENITGSFMDGRQVTFENGTFYYINKNNQKIKLFYYGNNVFGMEGKQFTRLKIPFYNKPIDFFDFFWDDGFVEKITRSN